MKKAKNLEYIFAVIVCFIGGFIEMYCFNTSGMYAAMMTGNLVNGIHNFIIGQYILGVEYISIILIFFICSFFLYLIKNSFHNKFKFLNLILVLEAFLLILSFFINRFYIVEGNVELKFFIGNLPLIIFGAFQLSSFDEFESNKFCSTMITVMFKNVAENLTLYIKEKEKNKLVVALKYFVLFVFFILGLIICQTLVILINESNYLSYLLFIPLGIIVFGLLPINFLSSKKAEE